MHRSRSVSGRPSRLGFTLVELSIVLMILGLIVGSVLVGESLIRAAGLRSITSDREHIAHAFFAFRDKYLAFPGDLANGYSFWGSLCGANSTSITSSAATTGCNGNGNGLVETSTGETVRVWRHLALSGLIEGSYDGTGSIVSGMTRGSSAAVFPVSKIDQARWNITNTIDHGAGTLYADWIYLHYGIFVAGDPMLGSVPDISLADAASIDQKIDDGFAQTGLLRGRGDTACTDSANDPYNLWGSNTPDSFKNVCTLTFILDQRQ